MKTIRNLVLVLLCFVSQLVMANNSPVPMLESVANNITTVLKANKDHLKNKQKITHDAIIKYMLPNVDVTGMARSVLGRQAWSSASAKQRQEFTKAFTKLVIRTYAAPLSEYTDEIIKFQEPRGQNNGKFARINSIIQRAQGQNIPLSYSLVYKNNGWKVYDFSVEGVSLLQSFHQQFSQALQNETLTQLITKMQKNNG